MLAGLFSFKGRLNRIQYVTIILAGYLLPFVAYMVFSVSVRRTDLIDLVGLAVIFGVTWIFFAAMAKRFHDIGKSGWACLLFFVPVVGQLTPIALMIYPGENKTNEFGAVPIYF
jgi:uncharacterized membrane protein YhaH (DUF805 family)